MQSNGNSESLRGIHHKFSQLSRAQKQRSIYKVHEQLRNINNKAYEPDIVAIGPYHHGKDSLKMMEEHKLRYLESLLLRKNQNLETFISAIGKMEQKARNHYAEPIGINATEFIEMLVLDGCFIIELLRKFNMRKTRCSGDPMVNSMCSDDPIFQMKWIINGLQRDLILFENQIPFFVLSKLYDLIEAPDQPQRLIYLILYFFQGLYPDVVYQKKIGISLDVEKHKSPNKVKHLLDLIHCNWRPPSSNVPPNGDINNRNYRFIHSATELRDRNVEFQVRKWEKLSDTLFDIDFEKGLMLMPPLTIEDRTECFFRNLIAYEQYFPNNQPTFVTDYVRLMDCLVNSLKDVEILSQCGIIDNWLGDNEVVANIFNRLTDSITGPGKHFVYAETFNRINTHYKKPRNRAMAVLRRDYFNSPWAYISFFAALVLLLLTVAQTVFSVLQVV